MNPKISVVVLTKNSQKYLNKCLNSILLQKYPNFEVIVVDSGSTDGTYHILDHYKQLSNIPFEIVHVPSKTSIGKARQIGLEKSNADTIAYIDSDVELSHENWLSNMVTPLIEGFDSIPKEQIAGVQTLSKNKSTDPWILRHLHSGFEYKNSIIDINHYEPIGTGHILIKKKCIEYVDGFRDIHSHEDIDITIKIMLKGYKFVYLPSEKVYHYHVDGLWHYIKKHMIRNKLLALRRIFLERE